MMVEDLAKRHLTEDMTQKRFLGKDVGEFLKLTAEEG